MKVTWSPTEQNPSPPEVFKPKIRLIDLNEYGYTNIQKNGVVIDDIEPYLAAKGDSSGCLDLKQLRELANRLQVTTRDKVKIFDLETCVSLPEEDDDEE